MTQARTLGGTRRVGALVAAALASLCALPSLASALTMIDFEGFTHGEVITSAGGVTIVADNFSRDFDLAVTFDSDHVGPTADPDLQAGQSVWSGGNLQGTQLGNMLILQENSTGCATGVCSNPDDEGRRPAGTLSFVFDIPVVSFGFDLIDIDSTVTEGGAITFHGVQGGSSTIDFATLLAGYVIGNNTANRIATMDLSALNLGAVGRVEFLMGGSGAIDNVNFQTQVVPEPTTAMLLGLGLTGLGFVGRRRRG